MGYSDLLVEDFQWASPEAMGWPSHWHIGPTMHPGKAIYGYWIGEPSTFPIQLDECWANDLYWLGKQIQHEQWRQQGGRHR